MLVGNGYQHRADTVEAAEDESVALAPPTPARELSRSARMKSGGATREEVEVRHLGAEEKRAKANYKVACTCNQWTMTDSNRVLALFNGARQR